MDPVKHRRTRRVAIPAAIILAAAMSGIVATTTAARAATPAPGAPGAAANWNEPSVDGFADSPGASSKVWYTLGNGELENAFYPETDTPDTFGLQYAVTNGSSFTNLETAGTAHSISLADPTSLTWQQVNTATNGDFKITKTYIADPSRSVILVQTTFDNLSSSPLDLYVDYHPYLNNDGMGNTGGTDPASGDLEAVNGSVASALTSSLGFSATSTGYAGTSSDGETMLTSGYSLPTTYSLGLHRRPHRPGRRDPGRLVGIDHVHARARVRHVGVRGDLRRGRLAGRGILFARVVVRVRLALVARRAERPARVGDRIARARGPVLRLADGGEGGRGQDLPGRVHRGAEPAVGRERER